MNQKVLSLLVVSQFLCTSLWFAGNAVILDLSKELSLPIAYLGHLTSAVQFGFIVGTLLFAIFTIADRFSPSKIFFASAIIAAIFNLLLGVGNWSAIEILLWRFGTGFFLAGIYPVGMKIAADYFQKGLGKSLGLLVGALVLGTAFPHLVRSLTETLPWRTVIFTTSALAFFGGFTIYYWVPDGPYHKRIAIFQPRALFRVFKSKEFRGAAFGYFGHMWELYAFWAFVPLLITYWNATNQQNLDVSFWAFLVIAVGGFSCAIGGLLSTKYLPEKIAFTTLFLSGLCCLLSPFLFSTTSPVFLLTFLLVWGLSVTADSPMFSTLVAYHAAADLRGSALTLVNCIGFSLTIVSIQVLTYLSFLIAPPYLFLVLFLGPLLGLLSVRKNLFLALK